MNMNDAVVHAALSDMEKEFSAIVSWSVETIKNAIEACAVRMYVERGWYYHPLRVALSGKQSSPPPQDIAAILGKEETLRRIRIAVRRLETAN